MSKCFIVRSNATVGVPVQVVVASDAHMTKLVGECGGVLAPAMCSTTCTPVARLVSFPLPTTRITHCILNRCRCRRRRAPPPQSSCRLLHRLCTLLSHLNNNQPTQHTHTHTHTTQTSRGGAVVHSLSPGEAPGQSKWHSGAAAVARASLWSVCAGACAGHCPR